MPVVCRRLRTPGGSEIVSWIIQCEVCEAWIPTGSNVADYGWQKISVGREMETSVLYYCPEHRVDGRRIKTSGG